MEFAPVACVCTELHVLAEAKTYYRWTNRQFAPFVGKRVIEVGAGIGTFAESFLAFPPIAMPAAIDSIVLINVLEHMAEDQAFLEDAHAALTLSGTVVLLVPALPQIYGRLDQAFGRYQRYTRTALASKPHVVGLAIIRLAYINLLGIAGWFLSGRVLKKTTLQARYVRWYDRWVIPWLSKLEECW